MKIALASLLFIALNSAPIVAAPPTRDPHTAGFVTAKELPDDSNPPPDADGNFVLGPTHSPAPESVVQANVPQGAVFNLTVSSTDSKIYPGIARDPKTFGTVDPADPAKLVVTTSHPAPYTRHIAVYVPRQYRPGTIAPFIVGADGADHTLFTVLDNLIAEKKFRPWSLFPLAMAAAMRRAANVDLSTTRCPADMLSSWSRRCCRWSKNSAAWR